MAGRTADDRAAPIRLGIAGLGLAGAMMIRAVRRHPRFVLQAGADPQERPRASFARDFGATVHADFAALCADAQVEAVYVASPHAFHADQAILALERGKHVLVEKPLALTLAECDRVIAAAAAARTHLIVGHTHGFDSNIQALRRLVAAGELGRLAMIAAFNYNDFLYRPRRPEELDTAKGGGVLFNQVSHQIEIVRAIAGNPLRSVRANVGVLDPSRPSEGNCLAFLEFENGAAASLVFSAYDFFDSDEMHYWIAESGNEKPPPSYGQARRTLSAGAVSEPDRQKDMGYGGRVLPAAQPHLPHFGLVIVTGAKGDVRLSPDGLWFYGTEGRSEIAVERGTGWSGHGDALDALWGAVREGRRDYHDARWGKATLEVALAILQSARERREIRLAHQAPDGG